MRSSLPDRSRPAPGGHPHHGFRPGTMRPRGALLAGTRGAMTNGSASGDQYTDGLVANFRDGCGSSRCMEEQLMTKKVAMVLANSFEDSEAIDPKNHLESLGAEVVTIGETRGTVQGKKGGALEVERTFDEVSPDEFDLLVIPGGGAPENLRIVDEAVALFRSEERR